MHNIPIYVYVIFFVLLYIGIKCCYTRTVPVKRLLLVPVLIAFLSLHGTLHLFGVQPVLLLCLCLGAACGTLLGYALVYRQPVQVNKESRQLQIPGSSSMLILLLSIFFVEFFIHYAVKTHLPIIESTNMKMAVMVLSGIIAGISIGRHATYILKFVRA